MVAGETYRITSNGEASNYDFKERLRSGNLIFSNHITGREKVVGEDRFEIMRATGQATLLRFRSPEDDRPREHLPPASLLDPKDPKLTKAQKKAAEAAAKSVEKARTLLFYVTKWDERPDISDSEAGVRRLVRSCKEEASENGLHWVPSYSTLHRARKIGQPGARSLALFLSERGTHDAAKRYPFFVLEAKQLAIDYYWSEASVGQLDAVARFFEAFEANATRLMKAGLTPPKRPHSTTVRKWILDARTYERHAEKYGKESAGRYFNGTRPSIDAEHALQYVMIDHTRCDHWAIIVDKDGNEIFRERPWIVAAVDVFSECVLAFMLTFESPSLITVMSCLKQVQRPKDFLVERYGDHKGATSVWGGPFWLVVDNAWENTGKSFQASCDSVGIRVKWAPVKTGQYKTFVEHLFHVLNKEVWHKGKGGVPFKPHEMSALGLNPREKTCRTIGELEALGWDYIVTMHHLAECSRRHMARARAWTSSLAKVGRHILNDVTALDRAFGAVDDASLTREGVRVGGHRFHDPIATTALLDSLARLAPPRQQSRSRLAGPTIPVQVVKDPTDCSFVNVWDFARKTYVRLPNVDPRFTEGLSWSTAKLVKDFAKKENLAFHSEEEKLAARAAFSRKRDNEIPVLPFREARKAVRVQQREMRRVPGEIIELYADPTPMGMAPADVPIEFAAKLQEGNRIPPKGIRRGRPRRDKKKDSRKAANTRGPSEGTSRADSPPLREYAPTAPVPAPSETREVFIIEDSHAFLAALAEDLE